MKHENSDARNAAEKKRASRGCLQKIIFFLSFSDPDLERRFLARQYKDNLRFNRIVAVSGVLAVTGFYLMNYFLNQPPGILLYWAPYLAAVTSICILIAMTFLDLSHHIVDASAVLTSLVINTAPLVSLRAYLYPDTLYIYTGCAVLLITSLIFVRISFYYMTLFAVLYVIAFELLYFGSGPHPAVLTWNLHYVVGFVIGVGIIVGYNLEIRERTNFVKLRIIVEERIKLSRLKDARLQKGRPKP